MNIQQRIEILDVASTRTHATTGMYNYVDVSPRAASVYVEQ